ETVDNKLLRSPEIGYSGRIGSDGSLTASQNHLCYLDSRQILFLRDIHQYRVILIIDDGRQGLVLDFDYSLDCLLNGYHPLIILISTQQNRNGLTEIDPCICSCRQVG